MNIHFKFDLLNSNIEKNQITADSTILPIGIYKVRFLYSTMHLSMSMISILKVIIVSN